MSSPMISTLLVLLVSVAACSLAATDNLVNIMVPAYFDPSANPSAWTALNSAAKALPNRVVAIANPYNGPSSAKQSSFAAAISSLQSSGGRVIGYVYSNYSNRTLDVVKDDVDRWYSFYPTLNGIFVDEVDNTDGKQPYYLALYNYIKSKSASSLVVNNPGTSTLASYLSYNGSRVADVICILESSGSDALKWSQATWTAAYPRSNFYALAYNTADVNVNNFDYGDIIDRAYQQNVGWVYVTNDNLPNPWDTIATYMSSEVNYIAQNNYLPS
ncbi:hypothetical protein GOP47_0028972 [Adiantum capillus-veneris]|nr:hypothetical protein GOP47_0028972 [Adiantum capillus-veneris]